MARNPSNLVPVPAFPSVFDMRHVAHGPLCTNRHKIKPRMRDWKYIYAGPSRGPRINSRPRKDPKDHRGGELVEQWIFHALPLAVLFQQIIESLDRHRV
jgi:hypothetical protein